MSAVKYTLRQKIGALVCKYFKHKIVISNIIADSEQINIYHQPFCIRCGRPLPKIKCWTDADIHSEITKMAAQPLCFHNLVAHASETLVAQAGE